MEAKVGARTHLLGVAKGGVSRPAITSLKETASRQSTCAARKHIF